MKFSVRSIPCLYRVNCSIQIQEMIKYCSIYSCWNQENNSCKRWECAWYCWVSTGFSEWSAHYNKMLQNLCRWNRRKSVGIQQFSARDIFRIYAFYKFRKMPSKTWHLSFFQTVILWFWQTFSTTKISITAVHSAMFSTTPSNGFRFTDRVGAQFGTLADSDHEE